jgi:hypothetical protein
VGEQSPGGCGGGARDAPPWRRLTWRTGGLVSVILTCFVLFCFLIAKQLAILKFLNNLKHATDRLQMPSRPQVVK